MLVLLDPAGKVDRRRQHDYGVIDRRVGGVAVSKSQNQDRRRKRLLFLVMIELGRLGRDMRDVFQISDLLFLPRGAWAQAQAYRSRATRCARERVWRETQNQYIVYIQPRYIQTKTHT